MLRAWYAGMPVRKAVERYLPRLIGAGESARGVLGGVRRRLVRFARQVGRPDLAAAFKHSDGERLREAKPVADAIKVLRHAHAPIPQISDGIGLWLSTRTVGILRAHGIATLADVTVRIPRRRQWWKAIAGLGPASARKIEAFFAAHPALTERARALLAISPTSGVVPWEQLRLPHEVDGSAGVYRAPRTTCTLDADKTTTRRCRRGCRCTNPRRRSARTARRPSGSSCGRLSNGGARCRRSPPRTRSAIARSCADRRQGSAGWDRSGHAAHPTGVHSRVACRPAQPRMRCLCWARCFVG